KTISRQQKSDNRSSRSHHQPLATSIITTTRKKAINLELQLIHSLIQVINTTIKDNIQNYTTHIVEVLLNKPARLTVRLNLLTAPQLDKFGAILANSRPTTSSAKRALRVIMVLLPEVHRRNKTAITVGRVLNNTRQLLIER